MTIDITTLTDEDIVTLLADANTATRLRSVIEAADTEKVKAEYEAKIAQLTKMNVKLLTDINAAGAASKQPEQVEQPDVSAMTYKERDVYYRSLAYSDTKE